MAIGDGFFGKIVVATFAGIISTILGMIIILGLVFVIGYYGVIPYLQNHLHLPDWMVLLIDKLL